MKNEKCIELIESILEDEMVPQEIRDELEWISYEDLEDGIDMADVMQNIKANYPMDIYPDKIQQLMKAFL